MKLSDYDAFPTLLPIVIEDDLFFYPFMISPIFLSSQEDIDAATHAMEKNSLLFVTSTREGHEGERGFDSIYSYGVAGSIMRKVHMPDGRVKILFQGLARAVIVTAHEGAFPRAVVDIVKNEGYNRLKVDALMDILRD
ncbi:MAG: endopeptidase La, partial [Epsilonproteobacteria bacterium]